MSTVGQIEKRTRARVGKSLYMKRRTICISDLTAL